MQGMPDGRPQDGVGAKDAGAGLDAPIEAQ